MGPDGKLDKTDRTKGWRSRMFANCMKMMSNIPAFSMTNIHRAFDWDSLGKAKVVDVG